MDIFGCIYVIRNAVDDKVYVGKTENTDLGIRWSKHKSLVVTGKGYYLHKAMRKHGLDNFTIEHIGDAYSKDALEIMETAIISLLNSTDDVFGYNMTHGGEGGTPTEATLSKLVGRKRTPEQRERYRLGALKRWTKPISDELRANMSIGQKRRVRSKEEIDRFKQAAKDRPPLTSEQREKACASQRAVWARPESVERRRVAKLYIPPPLSAEARAAIVASNKRRAGLSKPMPTKAERLARAKKDN